MSMRAAFFAVVFLCLGVCVRPSELGAQRYIYDAGNPSYGVNIPVENGFINVTNGNLHMEFHLANTPQRGDLTMDQKLVYDSHFWEIGAYSNYYWWPDSVPRTSQMAMGWRFVTGAETGTISHTTALSSTSCMKVNEQQGTVQSTYYTYNWQGPDGTVHSFNNGYSFQSRTTCPDSDPGPQPESSIGAATDASGYVLTLSGTDHAAPTTITIRDSRGVQVYPQVVDRYGNYWSFDGSGNLIDDRNQTPVITTVSGTTIYYDVLQTGGGRARYTVTTGKFPLNTAFNQQAVTEYSGTLPTITSIQLPDGSKYSFTYELQFGEMSSVTLPTGGVIGYKWLTFYDSYQNANRWVASRTVGSDPPTTFTPNTVTQCSASGTGCQEKVTVHRPGGDETVYSLTLNNGAWNTTTQRYAGAAANGALLSTTDTAYDFSNLCGTGCLGAQYVTASSVTTTLPGVNLKLTDTYTYSDPQQGLIGSKKRYDFYSGSLPSSPTVETDYTYGSTVPADVTQVTTVDGSAATISSSKMTYGTSPSVATSSLAQHDTSKSLNTYLQSKSTLISGGAYEVTDMQVDDAGTVRSTSTPYSSGSSPSGSRSFQYDGTDTFLTGVTEPAVPSGVALSLSSSPDSTTGVPTSTTDYNRQTTAFQNYDALGRVGEVDSPDGGVTTTSYTPTTRTTTVKIDASRSATTVEATDEFGRPSRIASANGQGSNPWSETDTCYDANGSVQTVSTPYAGSGVTGTKSCTGTSYTYDGLGRPLTVSNADSLIQYQYYGRATLTTEANGKQTISQVDGLGRTTAVCQLSSVSMGGASLQNCGTDIPGTGYLTSYSYNLANHTTTISQGGQTRVFQTDGLGRSTYTLEPERGVTTYRYAYNASGLQVVRTRPQVNQTNPAATTDTTSQYDALGRLWSVTYSDGTRGQRFGYDGKDESGGALSVPYSQNAFGRLSHTSDQINVASDYAYDVMGRLAQKGDCLASQCNVSAVSKASYDLSGNMSTMTYPDGRVIQNSYDIAGQLQSVNYQSWNGNAHNTPYATVPSGSFDPAGHVTGMLFGNGIGLAATYDSRQRVQDLAYGSSQQLLWGRQYSWTPNNNLSYTTDMLSGTQRQFAYDTLNRLTAAQDIVGSTSGANQSPYSTGNGGTSNGSSTGSTAPSASPTWTDPDDSNILYNPDVPGAQGWISNQVAIAPGVAAPDGSNGAYSVIANGGQDSFIQASAPTQSLLDNETMVGSVWLRSNSGARTINLYLVENNGSGYDVPASKPVNLTSTWKQYNLSGTFRYGQQLILFQIGGGNSFNSGEVDIWGAKLEDQGQTGHTVTNFLQYSQRTTAPTWRADDSSTVDNSAIAPDGTKTAATLTANPGNSNAALTAFLPNPALSGSSVTGSVWLRAPAGTVNLYLFLLNSGGNGFTNIAPQAPVTVTSAWTRYQLTGVNQAALSSLYFAIGGSGSFTNGQQVQVWGAQVELATTAGPYVATGGGAASVGTNLTNLLPNSSQLTGNTWGYGASSGQANAVTAPDGTSTGLQLTANAPDSILLSDVQNPALYNGATLTASVFLRAPSGSGTIHVFFAAQTSAGVSYLDSGNLTLTGNWKRFSFTRVMPNGLTRLFLQIGGANSFASPQSVNVWGPQVEIASTSGMYVPTNGLPVVTGQEPSNLLQSSQQVGGPGWGVANAAWAPNGAVAPNGTQTAALITASNGSNDSYAINYVPNPSLYDNQTVTGSVYLRVPNGQPNLSIRLFLPNVTDDSGFTAPNQLITVTNTWQRFSVTAPLGNGLTMLSLQIGGANTFTSNQQIQVWGTQMVVGSTPGVYQPSSSTTTNYSSGGAATLVANGLNDAYAYDYFGNMTQYNGSTPGYDGNNRMVGWPYDAAGNMLSNGMVPIKWDAESRMVSAGGSTYLYDAMGQRVESNGSGVTDTVYFGGVPVARLQNGQWTDLIYGATGLLAEVAGQEYADPQYRLVDHLGTLVGTTDSSQVFKNPLDYNPFGAVRSGSTADPYFFTGQERDGESGIDHFQFRGYSSNIGRWMSPDPYDGSYHASNPQSFNRYSYVLNSPTTMTDPDGLDGVVPCPAGTPSNVVICTGVQISTQVVGSATLGAVFSAVAPYLAAADALYMAGKFFGWWGRPEFKGSLHETPRSNASQPCEQSRANGKALDYSKPLHKGFSTMQHIQARHMPGVGKENVSTYWTQDWSAVGRMNYWTFLLGKQSFDRGSVVIDYTFPNLRRWLSKDLENGIGYDSDGADTLTNHLVLAPDCHTVITSYPIS